MSKEKYEKKESEKKVDEFKDLLKIKRIWIILFLISLSIFLILKKGLIWGLEINGGASATLKALNSNLTENDLEKIREVFETRFNVYGLTNLNIQYKKDLSNNIYFVIEAPTLTEKQIKEFIAKQGKFESKIGNKTIFTGENVVSVGLSFNPNYVPEQHCWREKSVWFCSGQLPLNIDQKAAQNFAEATKNLKTIGDHLNETIDFYLDGKLINNLSISSDLKGRPAQNVVINLVGKGKTKEEALKDLKNEIKKMKGLLETGSLPTKFEIVSVNQFSPKFGEGFLNNTLLIGIVSVLIIALIIYLKYPNWQIFLAVLFSLFSEILLIFGFAALVRWNLDLASLAGILVSVGTGVDDLIVFADNAIRRYKKFDKRMEEATHIVLTSWITTTVAMIPLFFLGLGLLKGFALTTIAGITIGVFITRPAYREVIKVITKKLEKERLNKV